MEAAKIKKILADMGTKEDVVFQPYRLKTIVMTANYGVDYLRDRMIYDSSDNMIKIKQYFHKQKSFLVNPTAEIIDDKVFSYNQIIFTADWPRPGNVLGFISKNDTTQLTTYTIKNVGMNFIQVDENIDSKFNLNDYYCIYFISDISKLVQDEINPTVFYEYKPYTDNPYDIYLDADAIIGFETLTRRVGNS